MLSFPPLPVRPKGQYIRSADIGARVLRRAAAQRCAQGAHYTTEKNILKVIEPLFMDDLRAEFRQLKSRRGSRRRVDLLKFQERLGRMKFLDPACGCGNFLFIAYRELRPVHLWEISFPVAQQCSFC